MARSTGTFNFPSNFEVKKQGPIDARLVVGLLSDLENLPFAYTGMIVSVINEANTDDNGVYILLGDDKTVMDNWKQLTTEPGLPTGGTSGQVLTKNSGTDYDVIWSTVSGGSSELTADVRANIDVGSIKSGETLSIGTTFQEFAEKLLIEVFEPNIINESVSTSHDKNGLEIVGTSSDVTVSTTADRGLVENTWDSGDQGPYAGPITAVELSPNGNTPISFGDTADTGDTEGTNETYTNDGTRNPTIGDYVETGYVFQLGNNYWEISVSFDDGSNTSFDPTYDDSAGNQTGSYTANTVTDTASFEGVYPIFKSDNTGSDVQRDLVSHSENHITISQPFDETNTLRHRIIISDEMINNRTVRFEQYNSVSGEYELLNSSEFVSSAVTKSIQGNSVNYTEFTKDSAPGGGDPDSSTPLYRIVFQ